MATCGSHQLHRARQPQSGGRLRRAAAKRLRRPCNSGRALLAPAPRPHPQPLHPGGMGSAGAMAAAAGLAGRPRRPRLVPHAAGRQRCV